MTLPSSTTPADAHFVPQVSPWIGSAELAAVTQVLESGWITEGPASAEFSRRLNALIGAPWGTFAPNGTLALALGLLALDIGPGDEVLVPDCTFVASANAVILTGATPVLVDVEPGNFLIDLADAARSVTPRTRAIMPVHLYGAACDMRAVTAFAVSHGLKVIEDAAQGIGVRFEGRHVGSFGDVGCFSFFADKTITTGEGGYVVCRDAAVYDRLSELRNQGRAERGSFIHRAVGFNFRITDVQAAIGLAQLEKLDEIVARKNANHARYQQALAGTPQVRFLLSESSADVVPFRCVLLARDAHDLMAHLASCGVQTRTAFFPLHRQPCFTADDVAVRPVVASRDYPNANLIYEQGVCLPVHPGLSSEDIERICQAIRAYYL